MKKRIISICITIASFFASFAAVCVFIGLPAYVFIDLKYMKSHMVQNDEAEIKNVRMEYKNQYVISKEEGFKEVEYISSLLHDAYIGYDALVEKGFNKEDFKKSYDDYFTNKSKVYTYDYERFLNDYFSRFVSDSHFTIDDDFGRVFQPTKEYFLYYSDIYVEKLGSFKQGYEYRIFESNVPGITAGDDYSDSEEKLFYYPLKGKNIYRVCMYSADIKSRIKSKVKVSNNVHYVDFYFDLNDDVFCAGDKFETLETDSSIYLRIPTFDAVKDDDKEKVIEGLKYIRQSGAECKKKKYVMIDLRGNTGGESSHFSAYLSGFMKDDMEFCEDCFQREVSTSMTIEKNQVNINSTPFISLKSKIIDNLYLAAYKIKYHGRRLISEYYSTPMQSTDFKGRIIILTDKYTASAAEIAIACARQLLGPRCITIGENTFGCCNYGGVLRYKLPYTGIYFNLCNTEYNYKGMDVKEGYGFKPDYCSTKEDLLSTLSIVVKDKEMIGQLENKL